MVGLVLVLAYLPTILLISPIIILFLGIIADPVETHAVWYGMLNTLGIFELPELTDIERLTYAEKRHYFWFGEVEMAAILAGTFVAPVGIFLAGRTDMSLAFIGAAVLFLPLFVFLPKLIQQAMKADTDAASKNLWEFFSSSRSFDLSEIDAFGKNEQVKKVFWTFFISMAGLVLARVVDPATAQQIVGLITGIGG
ncbi:hypothetical protein [Methanoregula sp. PtaU1.Bin006]|uniref:hypothetical protein n=1 Tax=Methanoregula sp. PtaU1.Bin006 TaxID=1811681 RepID=UPI0025F59BC2|nr:hypothetical protein [Methanoregula sp. PtaU1.Bin006]